jgi:hypothetical protein
MLTRDEFFMAIEPRIEKMPFGKGHVFVRTLSGDERGEVEKRFDGRQPKDDPADFRACIVALCTCDENGNPFLTLDDVANLKQKASGPVEPLFSKACELNGFTKKDIENLEKKSEAAPTS